MFLGEWTMMVIFEISEQFTEFLEFFSFLLTITEILVVLIFFLPASELDDVKYLLAQVHKWPAMPVVLLYCRSPV